MNISNKYIISTPAEGKNNLEKPFFHLTVANRCDHIITAENSTIIAGGRWHILQHQPFPTSKYLPPKAELIFYGGSGTYGSPTPTQIIECLEKSLMIQMPYGLERWDRFSGIFHSHHTTLEKAWANAKQLNVIKITA